jgi:holliday junction DNA helicase RuvA
MITFLEGLVAEKQPTHLVMNVGGVGYEVIIPLSSYDRVPRVGETCRMLTYDHVREDDHVLFGFATDAERRMFVMLMSVSGIGPKLALATLSGLSVKELKASIATADVKRLSSVSGIGKKTAERMVVDLKDKLSVGEALEATAGARDLTDADVRMRDAVLALISLGYKRTEAQDMILRVMRTVDKAAGVEEVVRKALAG